MNSAHANILERIECSTSSVADGSASTPELGLTQSDLADMMSAFNVASDRLQGTHQALQDEVSRLQRELSEANEQLRRSRELAALGQMAAGIAHEVRNPLGSIRLYATMLREDVADRPECLGMAEKIEQATSDLDLIVGDVLAFARELSPRLMPVHPVTQISQALEANAGMLNGTEIEIVRNESPPECSEWACLHADPGLLNQALSNLIRNGIEAIGEVGQLSISIEASALSDSRTGQNIPALAIVIEDSGGGFDESTLPKIFDPFFTTRSEGTGLGLAITHRIVDAHHGMIKVHNCDSGGGGCVRVTLPTTESALGNMNSNSEASQTSLNGTA